MEKINKQLKSRVFGIICINVVLSQWNKSFSNKALRTIKGEIFSSDFSIKYVMKRFEKEYLGSEVFNMKSYTDELKPQTLDERFQELCPELAVKNQDRSLIVNRLLKFDDVRKYGMAFASNFGNLSIRGVTQVSMGINKCKTTNEIELQQLSQFSSEEGKIQTTLGTNYILDKALFSYDYIIEPKILNEFADIISEDCYYSQKDLDTFKKTACKGVTVYKSTTKKGCYNDLSLFIELEEKSIFFPPSLTSLLEVKYEEKMRIYDFRKVAELLKSSYEEIKSIEVFYNPYEVKIENFITSDKLKKFNIFNMEEV